MPGARRQSKRIFRFPPLDLRPLQLFLREILLININNANNAAGNDAADVLYLDTLVKYAMIIISTVPILCIYPFVQKYFMKGVMMGSIKE